MATKQSPQSMKTPGAAAKAGAKAAKTPRKSASAVRTEESSFEAAIKAAVKEVQELDLPKPPKLSPEEARRRLQKLGIITKSGKLTRLYR